MKLLLETNPRAVTRFLGEASLGCLMARLVPSDAANIVKWSHEKIPQEALAGDGYENEIHVSVLYGFKPEVDAAMVQSILREWGQDSIRIQLGKITRFENDTDVLKVEVVSEDLKSLHYFLREQLGEDEGGLVEITHPDYKAHLTLAYVKSGALPELTDHCKFDGETYVFTDLVYSLPESTSKVTLKLGSSEE